MAPGFSSTADGVSSTLKNLASRGAEYQGDDQRAQSPVQQQGQRQQHEKGGEGREVLAQEREPQAKQRVGALPHDLELAARMRGAVKGTRQPQHVLEILAHRGQPAALREAIGVQRHQDAGADAPDADQAPDTEQGERLPPGVVARARAAAGERVDDPAEQERPDEGRAGKREIGQRERDREALVRGEQRQHPAVDLQEAHGGQDRSGWRHRWRWLIALRLYNALDTLRHR
jgi:hypothetical protein